MSAWLLEGGEAGDERTARSGHAEKWSSGFPLPMSPHCVREASSGGAGQGASSASVARLQNGPITYGTVALGVWLAGARRQLGTTARLRLCKGSAVLPV